jgi:hypothetical protein
MLALSPDGHLWLAAVADDSMYRDAKASGIDAKL